MLDAILLVVGLVFMAFFGLLWVEPVYALGKAICKDLYELWKRYRR